MKGVPHLLVVAAEVVAVEALYPTGAQVVVLAVALLAIMAEIMVATAMGMDATAMDATAMDTEEAGIVVVVIIVVIIVVITAVEAVAIDLEVDPLRAEVVQPLQPAAIAAPTEAVTLLVAALPASAIAPARMLPWKIA